MKQITIGTRASKLAMVQTSLVIRRLRQQWPDLQMTVEQIRTTGDRVTDMPLAQIGGDGIFVTEIERALHEKRIDVAVHSLKDLPVVQPEGLRLVITGPREDVRDVCVSNEKSLQVDANTRIGTGSLRRMAQIRALYPAAQILPIRGNVDTRLRKLEAHEYDCILLAAAGLHRLDLRERLAGRVTYLPIETMMPAPGQGALALEIRDEPEMCELMLPLADAAVEAASVAERMFMRHLGAGCYLPVAAHGKVQAETLTLLGLVIGLDGRRIVRAWQSINWTDATPLAEVEQLGMAVADQARSQGASEIITSISASKEQERYAQNLPLMGKRILVTRTRAQAGALSERLQAKGAIPVEFPTIRIVPPSSWEALDTALGKLFLADAQQQPYYSWLVFTSANGVHIFCQRMQSLGLHAQHLEQVRIAAIGPATAAALRDYAIRADLVPAAYIAESVAASLLEDVRGRGESLAGKHILLPRAAEARKILVSELQHAGAIVDEVPAYYTLPVAGDNEQGRAVLERLQRHGLDIITFTSSSTVRNFMHWLSDCAGEASASAPHFIAHNPQLKIACIGPITAQTAREFGLPVHIEAGEFTIEGLVEAIVKASLAANAC